MNRTEKKTDFSKYFNEKLPDNVIFDEFGVGATPGSSEHFLEYKFHPLAGCETAQDVYDFEWPDVDADYRFEGLEEKIRVYKQRGYVVMGELYQTLFETAWMMRGMEQLLVDLYINEEVADAIFEKLTELRIRQAEKYASLGVDVIRLGDDIATQLAPIMSQELYEKFIKQRVIRIVKAGKAINPDVLYFMHSCGRVEGLIHNFVDEGIDILNPIQPECNDMQKIADTYADKIAFWGGIGTQTTMPFGKPEDVSAEVKKVQKILGVNGGLLIAPSHILEPEVPWANVVAFVEAARNALYEK